MNTTKHDILFLHGALGIAEDLNPLMLLLKEQGHNCLPFQFPGHGKEAIEPKEFRIDLFANDLDNFIIQKKLKNLVIFGHSMGGYVALYHKAHFENSTTQKIFTYGTKFNWSENSVTKELPMLNPDSILERFPQFAQMLESKHGQRWKQLMRSTAHMMQNLERLDGLTKEDMRDIEIPIYLTIGDQDRMVTTEETQLTGSWLQHSFYKTISNSKHELDKANLKELAALISENLDP